MLSCFSSLLLLARLHCRCSSLQGPEQAHRYRRVLLANLVASIACTLAVALPVAVFAKPIMSIYGEQYSDGHAVLVLLSLTAVFAAINEVLSKALASRSRMWACIAFDGLWGIALIMSASQLIRTGYGAWGLAAAMVVAYAARAALQIPYILWRMPRESSHT